MGATCPQHQAELTEPWVSAEENNVYKGIELCESLAVWRTVPVPVRSRNMELMQAMVGDQAGRVAGAREEGLVHIQ